MGDVLGYARVSTDDQDLEGQRQRLKKAGVNRMFEDVMSGTPFGADDQLGDVVKFATPKCCPHRRSQRGDPDATALAAVICGLSLASTEWPLSNTAKPIAATMCTTQIQASSLKRSRPRNCMFRIQVPVRSRHANGCLTFVNMRLTNRRAGIVGEGSPRTTEPSPMAIKTAITTGALPAVPPPTSPAVQPGQSQAAAPRVAKPAKPGVKAAAPTSSKRKQPIEPDWRPQGFQAGGP
jgi:Resolvase, N terminal domain